MEKRTVALIGEAAYERLGESHVIVFGMGGVGGHCVDALARAGVGALTLVDCDVFDESNLNRQLFATRGMIGRAKVEAAAERILDITPACRVTPILARVCAENIADILKGGADFVCDAIDDIPAKIAIVSHCNDSCIPVVSCMGAGNRIGTAPFQIKDIFSTSHDPLARVMRKRLREAGVERLDVCVSMEEPYVSGARTPASISYVPAMAGLTLAGHIIRKLARLNGAEG